jgi:uncharacterized surface protein with fasciclin (FAS1) repeats
MRYQATRYILTATRSFVVVFVTLGLVISTSAMAGGHKSAAPAQPDIVDTAISAGSFTTLVAAIQAADLVDALKAEGPYTVFAPSDEAFAKMWPGTVDNLLLPENKDRLQALLLYHVVPGRITSDQLSGTVTAETLQGQTVTIVAADGVKVNYANVVAADIDASNGVIHVIDAVIVPAIPAS